MYKIEIGAGFMIAAASGFGWLQNNIANIVLAIIGIALILHGSYEVFFKPHIFLRKRITKWLQARHWEVSTDFNPGFYFIIEAKNEDNHRVVATRGHKEPDIIVFSVKIHIEKPWKPLLTRLNDIQKQQLVEDIRVYLTSKNMPYEIAQWPLDNLGVQQALPLDDISEHVVDLKAREVTLSAIGVRSLIRKALIPLAPHKGRVLRLD